MYHHKIVIKKLAKDTSTADVLYFLKKKHGSYMKKLNEDQVVGLVDKLKAKLGGMINGMPKKANEPIDEDV